MKAPLFALPWVILYQADLAYGNKANRINQMAQQIMSGNLCFSSILLASCFLFELTRETRRELLVRSNLSERD